MLAALSWISYKADSEINPLACRMLNKKCSWNYYLCRGGKVTARLDRRSELQYSPDSFKQELSNHNKKTLKVLMLGQIIL